MNDPAQLLSIFLEGALGRSGRKRARRAASFVSGNRGLISASTILAAAGVAWGIYDSLKQQGVQGVQGAQAAYAAQGAPATIIVHDAPGASPVPAEVLRIVRLAVSAARADGQLTAPERALILEHARKAGVEAAAEQELAEPRPLADIVGGVTDETARKDLYQLAYTIIRAE